MFRRKFGDLAVVAKLIRKVVVLSLVGSSTASNKQKKKHSSVCIETKKRVGDIVILQQCGSAAAQAFGVARLAEAATVQTERIDCTM